MELRPYVPKPTKKRVLRKPLSMGYFMGVKVAKNPITLTLGLMFTRFLLFYPKYQLLVKQLFIFIFNRKTSIAAACVYDISMHICYYILLSCLGMTLKLVWYIKIKHDLATT